MDQFEKRRKIVNKSAITENKLLINKNMLTNKKKEQKIKGKGIRSTLQTQFVFFRRKERDKSATLQVGTSSAEEKMVRIEKTD